MKASLIVFLAAFASVAQAVGVSGTAGDLAFDLTTATFNGGLQANGFDGRLEGAVFVADSFFSPSECGRFGILGTNCVIITPYVIPLGGNALCLKNPEVCEQRVAASFAQRDWLAPLYWLVVAVAVLIVALIVFSRERVLA